jgi:hypothetical protein
MMGGVPSATKLKMRNQAWKSEMRKKDPMEGERQWMGSVERHERQGYV